MAIQPQLSEKLLPSAFRDFVINGVRDRTTPQILQIADRGDITEIRDALTRIYQWENLPDKALIPEDPSESSIPSALDDQIPSYSIDEARNAAKWERRRLFQALSGEPIEAFPLNYRAAPPKSAAGTESTLGDRLSNDAMRMGLAGRRGRLLLPTTHTHHVNGVTLFRVGLDAFDLLADHQDPSKPRDEAPAGRRGLNYNDVESFLLTELNAAYDFLEEPDARFLWANFCGPDLAHAIRQVRRGLTKSRTNAIMSRPYTPDGAITERIAHIRREFFHAVEATFPEAKDSTTANLAWHIIVESSLLNEQLVEDMQRLASEKNAWCLTTDWQQYYGPRPPMESCMAFNEYVKARWPIHVFALDPVTQDQNVASGFSLRREMQLLLAVAASRRLFTLQSLTQFVRRLEYDLETIDINRTAVGFTHGSDTFGWRFYPRVQVPEVKGNLAAAFHDLLGGGPNRDDRLNSHRLEPGIRECTALVVLPSFVPFVTLDTRTSWFRLADHHRHFKPRFLKRKGDLRNAVDLSAEITELRCLSQACMEDAHLYRNGEVYRLQRAVHTLDRQLPMQTTVVELPYENLLGGSDLFNSSTLGLRPTLRGWYGAPGIVVSDGSKTVRELAVRLASLRGKIGDLKATQVQTALNDPADANVKKLTDQIKSLTDIATATATDLNTLRSLPEAQTTLYLVGRNFSVLDTRVIAGGKEIPDHDVQLISRDVIQITVPSTVSTVKDNGRHFVDIHLATPYGPTPRLRIPVADEALAAASAAAAAAADAQKSAVAAKESAKQAQATSPGFDWGASELTVHYAPTDGSQPASLAWNSPRKAVVKHMNTTPFREAFDVRVAFYLAVKHHGASGLEPVTKNDGKDARLAFVLDDVLTAELDEETGLSTIALADGLLQKLNEYLAGTSPLEEAVVECYLELHEQHNAGQIHTDALPVVRLPDLKLKVVKPPKPETATANLIPTAPTAEPLLDSVVPPAPLLPISLNL